MQLVAHRLGDALVVRVDEARIDAAVAIRFKDHMRELAEDGPCRVILDLSQVNFLDSSGLGAVVSVMKMMAPDQVLELAGLTPMVAKVFTLTRMDSVFTIYDEVPDADDTAPQGRRHAV